jgi:succinate dehydrogenase / fumarate reductase cytochrome b subunit
MSRLGNALASSIGKKIVMGTTGLLLVGFLVEHLHGNLKLIEDPSGEAFNGYVAFLQSFGPLLRVAEIGLALLFLAHIYLAFRLTLENLQARRERYVVRGRRGGSSAGSVTMFYSGALILAYVLKHLYDFRFDARYFEDPAGRVRATLGQPVHAGIYVAAALVLGLHLSHGFRSAFQSLGINHPSWNPVLVRLGMLVSFLFAVGFASIPLYLLFSSTGGAR